MKSSSHWDNIRASIKRPIRVPVGPRSAVECYPCREVSLNYNRSLLFHGGDTGSTPVRDASNLGLLRHIPVLNPNVALFEWSAFKVVNLDLHAGAIEHLRHFAKVLVDPA